MTPIRSWRLNYRAVFGPMPEQTATAWESYIDAAVFPRPSQAELDEGMASLCDRKQQDGGKPSVLSFAGKIRQNRNGTVHQRKERTIAAIDKGQRIIRYATTLDQVWNAICHADLELEEREALRDWAAQARPDLADSYGNLRNENNTVTMDEILRTVRLDQKRKASA